MFECYSKRNAKVLALNSRTHEFLPFDAQLHSENHIGSIVVAKFQGNIKNFSNHLVHRGHFFQMP